MTEKKLNQIEQSLNFYQPSSHHNGGGTSGKKGLFLVVYNYGTHNKEYHNKSNNVCVKLSKEIANKFTTLYKDLCFHSTTQKGQKMIHSPVAFSLGGGEENYIILNPANNVPHFKAKMYPDSNRTAEFSNKVFVNDLYKLYKWDDTKEFQKTIYINYFAKINGMDLYRMSLTPSED